MGKICESKTKFAFQNWPGFQNRDHRISKQGAVFSKLEPTDSETDKSRFQGCKWLPKPFIYCYFSFADSQTKEKRERIYAVDVRFVFVKMFQVVITTACSTSSAHSPQRLLGAFAMKLE